MLYMSQEEKNLQRLPRSVNSNMSYLQKSWPLLLSVAIHLIAAWALVNAYPQSTVADFDTITVYLTTANTSTQATAKPKLISTRPASELAVNEASTADAVQSQSIDDVDDYEPAVYQAEYLHNPQPAYPVMSMRRGEQGRVLLHVVVTTAGDAKIVSVNQTSGYLLLDHSALETVKTWRFVPAKRRNHPVESDVLVPVRFTLES